MKLMRSTSFGRKCLNQEQQSAAGSRIVNRKPQTEGLRQKEAELGKLAAKENEGQVLQAKSFVFYSHCGPTSTGVCALVT